MFKSHNKSFKSSKPMCNLMIEALAEDLYDLSPQETSEAKLLNPPQDHPNPNICKRLRNCLHISSDETDCLLVNNSKDTWPFRLL